MTGLPSLDWPSQIMVGQFTDAVMLAVEAPIVARAPASLGEYLSSILPLVVVQLTGEDNQIDTGMFWAPVQQDGPEQIWLRAVMRESLAPWTSGAPELTEADVVSGVVEHLGPRARQHLEVAERSIDIAFPERVRYRVVHLHTVAVRVLDVGAVGHCSKLKTSV